MASTAQLERVRVLVERLAPLSNAQRGELIRADDWNALVSALVDVARALLDPTAAGVPTHEHIDQVTLAWLHPTLRVLVDKSVAGSADAATIAEIQRNIKRFADRSDRTDAGLTEVRTLLADVRSSDTVRGAQVNTLAQAVTAATRSREELLELRTTLGSIQTDVKTVGDIRANLTENGQLIDVRSLRQRITSVEDLRTRLTLPSGQLLDAVSIEDRFSRIGNGVVTRDDLRNALSAATLSISDERAASIRDSVTASVRSSVETSINELGDRVRAETSTRLAGVEATARTAATGAVGELRTAILDAAKTDATRALTTRTDELTATLGQRLASVEGTLRTAIDDKAVQLAATLGTRIDQQGAQLGTRLAPLETSLAASAGRVTQLETRGTQSDEQLRALDTRLLALDRTRAGDRATLDTRITELSAQQTQRTQAVDSRFTQLDAAIQARITAGIADTRAALVDQFRQIATAQIDAERTLSEERLRTEMRTIVNDSFSGFRDQLRTMVTQATRDATNSVLPGLVNTAVQVQTAGLEERLRGGTRVVDGGTRVVDGGTRVIEGGGTTRPIDITRGGTGRIGGPG